MNLLNTVLLICLFTLTLCNESGILKQASKDFSHKKLKNAVCASIEVNHAKRQHVYMNHCIEACKKPVLALTMAYVSINQNKLVEPDQQTLTEIDDICTTNCVNDIKLQNYMNEVLDLELDRYGCYD